MILFPCSPCLIHVKSTARYCVYPGYQLDWTDMFVSAWSWTKLRHVRMLQLCGNPGVASVNIWWCSNKESRLHHPSFFRSSTVPCHRRRLQKCAMLNTWMLFVFPLGLFLNPCYLPSTLLKLHPRCRLAGPSCHMFWLPPEDKKVSVSPVKLQVLLSFPVLISPCPSCS